MITRLLLIAILLLSGFAYGAGKGKTLICESHLTDAGESALKASKSTTPQREREIAIARLWMRVKQSRRTQPEATIGFLNQILQMEPQDPAAHRQMGTLYLRMSEPRKAIEHLSVAFNARALDQYAAATFLKLFAANPELDEGVDYAQKALSQFPNSGGVMLTSMQLLMRAGRYDLVLPVTDRFIRVASNSSLAWYIKIRALIQLKLYQEALRTLEPLPADYYKSFYRAKALVGLNRLDEAATILKSMRQDSATLWLQARISFLKGDMRAAYLFLVTRIQLPSTDPDLWAIAALIKIDRLGGVNHSTVSQALLSSVAGARAEELNQMADRLNWNFLADKGENDSDSVSLVNPFWNRLNDRPVDGHTHRTTR